MLILYSAITLLIQPLLAGLEYYRRKRVYGKVQNINHAVSTLLGVVWTAVAYYIVYKFTFGWFTLYAAFIAAGARLMLYDFFLNWFCHIPFHNSATSNSQMEQRLNHISFWERRLIGLLVVVITLLLHYFL